MNEDKEKFSEAEFLSRWSRLKRQAREQSAVKPPAAVPAVDPQAPPPELPPVDQLTIDSDFSGFFHPKVDESLRRAALRKLFADPHFNIMDGLDTYIDDYSQPNPLPAAMLAQLKQAQKILDWARQTDEEVKKKAAEPPAENIAPPMVEQPVLLAAAAEQSATDQLQDAVQRNAAPATIDPKS